MAGSSEMFQLRRHMALLKKLRNENELAMAQIRERMSMATAGQQSAQSIIANSVEPQMGTDNELANAAVLLQELAGTRVDTHGKARVVLEVAEANRSPQRVVLDSPLRQSATTQRAAQNIPSSSPQSCQKQASVQAASVEILEIEKASSNAGLKLASSLKRSDAQPLSTSVTPATPHAINQSESPYPQHTLAPQGHYPTQTQTMTSFASVPTLTHPSRDRSHAVSNTQARLVPENPFRNQLSRPSPPQRILPPVQIPAPNPGAHSTQHALFASQWEAQQRAQLKKKRDASSQQANSQGQAGPPITPTQHAPHATFPHSQGQLGRFPIYRLQGGRTGMGQYPFGSPYQQQGLPVFIPANLLRTPFNSYNAGPPSGVGKSRLTRKPTPATQRRQPARQLGDAAARPEELPQQSEGPRIHPLPLRRNRSPSIIITDDRPAKKQHQDEDVRIMTPPLNDDGSPMQPLQRPVRNNAPRHMCQQVTSPRQLSRSQDPSSQESSIQGDIDECNAAPQPSRQQVQQHGQGHSPQPMQPDPPARNRLVLPRASPQPYALHMQQRATQSGSNSPPSRTTKQPSRHRRKRSNTETVIAEVTHNYPYHPYRNPSRPRSKRHAATTISPGTYKIPFYRRLTPNERSKLELRYCAHLARYLCSNTCVTSPPYPLSNENLWTRMSRRFLPEPGRPSPPGFNSNEVYHTAADFEADVKAMLKQYIVMGHCGEQPIRDANGHEVEQRCEFEKTGNARVMCWRMRLESVLDEKLRDLKMRLRECEEGYVAEDMEGKKGCIDGAFLDARLGE